MSIVGGLDVHRAQITYDYLDVDTGEVETGRIIPATRTVFWGRFAFERGVRGWGCGAVTGTRRILRCS